MSIARAFGRATRSALALAQSRNSSPLTCRYFPLISNQFDSFVTPYREASVFRNLLYSTSTFQQAGFSTSASPEHNEKERTQSGQEQSVNKEANSSAGVQSGQEAENKGTSIGKDSSATKQKQEPGSEAGTSESPSEKGRKRGTKRTAFSDSDPEGDLDDISRDDLIKLVTEKEEILQTKQKEIAAMQDKVLRSYAEMENVMDRTRREAENSKKFAIQNFAKNLLDVADNLGRASSVVKESFAKIDVSQDTTGTSQLLKTFLEGVEMTEKQLIEVFRKFGVEKYDPTNEQFDPNRHNAVFQVPDNSKPSGTVAVVLKSGYVLHDRVIRPAEVGVTQAAEDGEAK